MDASFWDGKRAPGIVDTINVNEYDSVVERNQENRRRPPP